MSSILGVTKEEITSSIKGFMSTDYGIVTIGGVAGAWGSTILAEAAANYVNVTGLKKLFVLGLSKLGIGALAWHVARKATGSTRLMWLGASIGTGISFGIDILKYIMGGKTAEQQGYALAMKLRGFKHGASASAVASYVASTPITVPSQKPKIPLA